MTTGPERLGRWLDVTMTNRGLRNRALAKQIGKHESAVHNWRKGKNVPELPTLQQLAHILGVDPIRLAVTAGLLDAQLVGAEPLPLPEPTARRAKVRHRATELIDELTALTEEMKAEGETEETTLKALETIRKLVLEGDMR